MASALARPLIWFFVIGAGVNALVDEGGTGTYQQFLVPGVIGMTMLFGAMLVSLSVAYERESGVMRLLISAPIPHWWIVLAKILAACLVALIQAAALMILLAVLGYLGDVSPWLLLALLATALACASLGMLVAVFTSSLDNFAVMMNFVIFPVFFLSGALYPVQRLPEPLKTIATVNPFTHCVDLLKHAILGEVSPGLGTDFGAGLSVAVVVGFTAAATLVACLRFSHESRAGLLGFLRTGS
jgi:ABC-2 type transport system permease protein